MSSNKLEQSYSVVLTQNYSSVDVQPPLPQIYCDHKKIIKFRSQKFGNMLKRNCSQCGCFIALNGITTVKELGQNFEADISPIEQYENILDDEQFMSCHHYYQTHTSMMSDNDRVDLNSLRTCNIEKIFLYGEKLSQSQLTIHLACAYFDYLLFKQFNQDLQQKSHIDRGGANRSHHSSVISQNTPLISDKHKIRKLSLKAQMCLLLASKFDELDDRIPMIRDFQKLSRYEFAYKECKDEEELVLNQLNWSLQFITPLHVVQCMQAMGIVFEDDRVQSEWDHQNTAPINDNVIKQVRKKSDYFADLTMKSEWEFHLYSPSLVGLACILASRFECKIVPMWNEKFHEITGYTMDPYNEVFECFEKLYSLHDQNYKSIKLQIFGNIKTQKSLLSTCDPNLNGQTNDSIHILGQTRKSNILEQNQNVINDSLIIQKGLIEIQDSNVQHYEYNDEIDLGDESMLSKKLIDHIPSLNQSNKQSHILFNNAQSVNQSCSQRSSVSTLNIQKPTTSNQTKQSIIRDSQKLLQKKKSDLGRVNKENSQIAHPINAIVKNNSKVKPAQKSCRLSSNPAHKIDEQALKLQSIESTKNFNSSQLLSMPVTRCTTNISHVNQLNSTTNSQAQQKNQINMQMKQRNQSATNLHQGQPATHHPSYQGNFPQKSMIKLNVITQRIQSHQNQQQQQISHLKVPQLSTLNQNLSNQITNRLSSIKSQNNSRSRKQSICSGSSLTRYQYNANMPKQCQISSSSSIINQKLKAHQSTESIQKVDAKQFASKSNRQSTSNVMIDLSRPQRENSNSNKKITELVQKYQSENTIYEKSMAYAGRNSNLSMLGGFQVHSKTFAALHNTIHIQHNSSLERPASECDNAKNRSSVKRDSKITQSQSNMNTNRFSKQGEKLQFQTIQEPKKARIPIMEEDNEGEKSNIDFEKTQLQINFDEYQVAEDDSVVIKKPMSSKKSKSLENVNKVVKNRKASVTSKAIIELYKKQYQQQQSSSQCETRNYSVQQPTKVTTVDMSYYDNNNNISCNQTKEQIKASNINNAQKTNYIKKNINFISVLNNHGMLSLESSHIDNIHHKDTKIPPRENSNTQSNRNSRCSMNPQHILSQNHSTNSKNILFTKQSISQRRFSKYKNVNNSTSQNHSLNSRPPINQSKSNQPSNRILNQNRSQAMFLDERRSQEMKHLNSDYFVINPETTLGDIDQDQTLEIDKMNNKDRDNSKKRAIQYPYNLSASSSQIHLKERPYHRFLNQDHKQTFQDFSKNFKDKAKKSPVQNQIHKMKFETIKIKIISPKGIEEKSPVIQQLKSYQFISKNENHVKSSRRASNQSLNMEFHLNSGRPPLSHRSNQSNGNQNQNDKSCQILNNSSSHNLVKYHKFQSRKPIKSTNNRSLIEQALLKKSKLQSILKPFESYQVAQTLDNTYETTFDEKNTSYTNIQVIPPIVQSIPKNQSANRSSLMIPVLNQHCQIQGSLSQSGKNQSLLNIKSPSNIVTAIVNTQQDIPPAPGYSNARHLKQSQVLKSSNKLQKSLEKNLPTIQAPVSARISSRYNELNQKELVIKEEDEYRQISGLFKKAQINSYKYNK